MASRDEILANFQACTGIDDIGEAIAKLEAAAWVLMDAVNASLAATASTEEVAPSDRPSPPATAAAAARDEEEAMEEAAPAADVGEAPPPAARASTSREALLGNNPFAALQSGGFSAAGATTDGAGGAVASTSTANIFSSSSFSGRMLDFYVSHHERTFHLRVPDTEDVKSLKNLIRGETGCPPTKQNLSGFRGSSSLPPTDRRRLCDLNLPRENFLQLTTPEFDEEQKEAQQNGDSGSDAPENLLLHIRDEETNNSYALNFRPNQSLLSIKLDIFYLTDIPVSKQIWTGWPSDCSDELSLAQMGIRHEQEFSVAKRLEGDEASTASSSSNSMPVLVEASSQSTASTSTGRVTRSRSRQNGKKSEDANNGDEDEGDSEEEDNFVDAMEDDDLDFFSAESAQGEERNTRLQPLIPDDYGDEPMAAIKFAEEFSGRYGQPHPNFFPGSLEDAIRESCHKPAKQRKMLAIYLHHNSSVLTNVFCTQALCTDSVVAFMEENFVSFGWDLTCHSNKTRLLSMVTKHFGSLASATIRDLRLEKLPLLALVYKLRGTLEIFQVIHGNVTLDELMSQLLASTETFHSQLSVEVKEEEEREARNAVKREQDLAFELAEQADREKEEQRQREESDRLEQERLEAEKLATEEENKRKEEQEKERRRLQIERRLPPEPPADSPAKVARLRIRVPNVEGAEPPAGLKNGCIERRFLAGDSLAVLLDFLASKGFHPDEFKVLSAWPRRDLTTLSASESLEALKLYPQETLTLEER